VRLTIFVAHAGQKTAYFAISLLGKIWTDLLRVLLSPKQKMQRRFLRLTKKTITNGKGSPADCAPDGESVDLCTLGKLQSHKPYCEDHGSP
jgi:hypothetical protein